jgi:phosphotriesterase-related protein
MTTRRQFLAQSAAALAGAALSPSLLTAKVSPLRASRPARSAAGPRVRPIPTATGEILPEQMGITSLHEHIALRRGEEHREESLAYAIHELQRAKVLGLRTIVDVGPPDDVAGIQEVARATGINVICCTGFYLMRGEQLALKAEDFESKMLQDIEHGLQGTSVRPGVIKVAAARLPIRPAEKELFIAAARVQQKYHLPICTHAVSGCAEQQQILEEVGADLRRCYFSHIEATFGWSGRSVEQEIDYLEGVVAKGSTLSFNNFGNWNHTKPEDLAHIIRELVRRGYADRLVATMDVTWSFEQGKLKLLWEDTNVNGRDRTYAYLLDTAVPWMQANGISKDDTDKFIIGNPRRIFTSPLS